MATTPSPRRKRYGNGRVFLHYYLAGDVNLGDLRDYIAPCDGRIVDVMAHMTENTGSGSTILDVEINGTSIFADASRPTLAGNATGYTTMATFPQNARVNAGDIITLACDQEASDNEHLNLKAVIVIDPR